MAQAIVDLAHIATHPSRVRIARELSKDNMLTVSELGERIPIFDEDLIRFHLAILEKNGLVESQPETGNSPDEPRVVIHFKLTPEFSRVLKGAQSLI